MSCRKNHMKQICSKFGNNLQISNRWYHACVKCMYASLHGIYIHGRYNLKYQRTFKQCTHYPCICSSCPRFRKQIQILHKALEVYECSRVHVLKILNLSALASISRWIKLTKKHALIKKHMHLQFWHGERARALWCLLQTRPLKSGE